MEKTRIAISGIRCRVSVINLPFPEHVAVIQKILTIWESHRERITELIKNSLVSLV